MKKKMVKAVVLIGIVTFVAECMGDCPVVVPKNRVKARFSGFTPTGRTAWDVIEIISGDLECKTFVDGHLLLSMSWGSYTEEEQQAALESGQTPDYFMSLVKDYHIEEPPTGELAEFLESEELVIDGKPQIWTLGVDSCQPSQTPGDDRPTCEVCVRRRPSGYTVSFQFHDPEVDACLKRASSKPLPCGGGDGKLEKQLQPPVEGGNNALFFDGINDYVEIPEITAMRTHKDEPLTVEFWLFVECYGGTWHKALSKWGAGGGQDDEFVVCLRQDGTYGLANTGSTSLDSKTPIPTNVWCHFCCVWDGANDSYELYLNSEFVPQELKGGAPLQLTGEAVRIGTDGHKNQCFRGMIDEVRLWNITRSQEEVRAAMRRKLTGRETGLVGYWNFNEGQGQVAFDLADRSNWGRLGNTPFQDSSDPRWVSSSIDLVNP